MYLEVLVLVFYLAMLYSMVFAVQNVEFIANHPRTEQIVNKITYNLRNAPRVNYKEVSSEEEMSESSDEDLVASSVPEKEQEVHRRRDPNPMSRIIEEVLN